MEVLFSGITTLKNSPIFTTNKPSSTTWKRNGEHKTKTVHTMRAPTLAG